MSCNCKEDLSLKLLAGFPIMLDSVGKIYPLKLKEIVDLGYQKYNYYLSLLIFNKDSLKADFKELEDISNFEIVYQYSLNDINFQNDFISALELFFRERPVFDKRGLFYFGDITEERLIYLDNFDELQKIIKMANNFKLEEVEELDEFDKRVMEAEKMLSELENDNEILDFKDLISSLTNMSDNDINIFNVWDLTLYQIHDQFKRGQLKEKFYIDLKSIFAGAKPDSVQLEHYIKNIK